jgi:hypothetical protein
VYSCFALLPLSLQVRKCSQPLATCSFLELQTFLFNIIRALGPHRNPQVHQSLKDLAKPLRQSKKTGGQQFEAKYNHRPKWTYWPPVQMDQSLNVEASISKSSMQIILKNSTHLQNYRYIPTPSSRCWRNPDQIAPRTSTSMEVKYHASMARCSLIMHAARDDHSGK